MRLIDADALKEEITCHFDLELEPVIEKEALRMIDEQETISDCISRQAAIDANTRAVER